MVKNTKGGNSHKKQARKNVNQEKVSVKTRFANPNEPCEMYANVLKLFGNGYCEVKCNDEKVRLCVIRKVFRRNKRGNMVTNDTKVLVGLRDWETKKDGKKEKCDLLEVYKPEQHSELKKDPLCNWENICSASEIKNDCVANVDFEDDDNIDVGIDFGDEEEDYEKMKKFDDIDFDDI